MSSKLALAERVFVAARDSRGSQHLIRDRRSTSTQQRVFMNTFRSLRFLLGVWLALTAGLAPPAHAQSNTPEIIHVETGTHKLLRYPSAVGRVAIGDPKTADVNVINGRELLVNGIKPGITSLLVWPRSAGKRGGADAKEYRISVGALPSTDPELAQLDIQPNGALDGTAPNLLAHRRAVQIAGPGAKDANADRSAVFGETQVTSQVRIVEVNRTSLQQYGFNVFKNSSNTLASLSTPSSITGVQSNTSGLGLTVLSATGFLPAASAFNLLLGNPQAGLFGALSVLQSNGLARVLAEPSLTALSGQTASFLAGGEFPYPVPQSSGSGTGGGTITVQFREFGVRLNLTPTVLSSNRIAMKVAPEVSDLDFTNALQISGTTVPGLVIRRTDTTVELGDGETFVISGLVSNNLTNNINKVPWLGDIPVLGAFFRSTTINRQEKELIMIVTPHLVRPIAKGAPLPPLPGESTDRYRPNFAETMFLETGNFGQTNESGYSK